MIDLPRKPLSATSPRTCPAPPGLSQAGPQLLRRRRPPPTDHILPRDHDTHRSEPDCLIPLAQKVEAGHGDREPAPLGQTEALLALPNELESHMAKAEQVLFPMMRQGGHPMIAPPINGMRHEHASAAALLRGIVHVTNDLTLPEGACPSRTTPHTGLEKHSDDLAAPIHLENEVRLPRVKAA